MSAHKRPRKRKPVEHDLFGAPVLKPLPRRTVVLHPQREGFTIAVRQAGTAAIYVGIYATEGEAWQALHDGVGKTHEEREAVRVTVYRR